MKRPGWHNWMVLGLALLFTGPVIAQENTPLWFLYKIGVLDEAQDTNGVNYKIQIRKGNKAEVIGQHLCDFREWKFFKVDISKYRGKRVVLRFDVDANGDPKWDWSGVVDAFIVEGVLPEDYQGGELPQGTELFYDLSKLKVSRKGYILDGKEMTPINTAMTGAKFDLKRSSLYSGKVKKKGFDVHPGWKGETKNSPVFGEFKIKLKKPKPEKTK